MNNHDNKNKKDSQANGCVLCFSNLGVDSRMEIYKFLRENGKKTVSEVVEFIGLTQPTVSYHLKSMKDAGILLSERIGKEVFYCVSEGCPSKNHSCVLKNVNFQN